MFCYVSRMKTYPMAVRLDKSLLDALCEGALRTPHKKQELVRLTLRRHLREVIEQEAVITTARRVTNIEPWPEAVIARAYKRIGKEWDALEEAATRAQGTPDFND